MAEPNPNSGALARLEDAALAARVKAGDHAAFDEIVRRYLRPAYSVAYRMLRHAEDAEDLVQEAFLLVLEKIDHYDPARPFGPWFYRLLLNRSHNVRRSRAIRATEPLPAEVPAAGVSPYEAAERSQARGRLARALERLPERQRTIVQLFELEGFSGAEIGAMLEISPATVRWHLHEARKALREALAPSGAKDDDA